MTSNAIRIFGVPEDLSDGYEVTREASTEEPIQNPTPALMPSGRMTYAQASEELRKLAVADNWTALYDPGNADFVTVTAGVITEIRDVLGNLPPLVVSSGAPAHSNAWGSLRPFTGGAVRTSGTLDGGTYELLGLTSTPASSSYFARFTYEGSTSLYYTVSCTDYGRVTQQARGVSGPDAFRYGRGAAPGLPGERWTVSLLSRGGCHIGNFPVADDAPEDDTQVDDVVRGLSPTGIRWGDTGDRPIGPFFVSNAPISSAVRERADKLLCLLSDSPLSIPEPEESVPDGYFIGDENNEPLAWHRPDRRAQLASLTKVWTCALAYKLFTNAGFSLDQQVGVYSSGTYPNGYTSTKEPAIHAGDTISFRDALHGALLVSHNQLSDTIAHIAGRFLPSDGQNYIPRFVDYMQSEARALGWDNATFSTPSGLGNNQMSSRQYSELLNWVRINVPEVMEIMGTQFWDYELTLLNPPDPEEPIVSGQWENLVSSTSEGVPLPELVGGKGGLLTSGGYNHRTIAAVGYNPVTGGFMNATALDTGHEYAFRYRLLRYLWSGVETRNGPPPHWTAGGTDSILEWGRSGVINHAVAFHDPYGEGVVRARPMDPFQDSSIRVEPGDVVVASLLVRALPGPSGVPAKSFLRIENIGGLWDTGSNIITNETTHTFPNTWYTRSVTGTVQRGGILDVYVDVEAFNQDQASVFVRNFKVIWNVTERRSPYFELDLRDYSANEHAQSIDASDPAGAVGGFTAECVMPESGTVIERFGPNWLKGRDARIYTRQGEMQGLIKSLQVTDNALLTLNASSVFQDFVSQNAVGEPFSGGLEYLLYNYISQASRVPPKIVIDPSLQGLQVVAPYWEGDLWTHLKLLAAAFRFNLRVNRFEVLVEPVPRPSPGGLLELSNATQMNDGETARFVEVVKYSGRVFEEDLVYPPGGVSDDTSIISVDAGRVTEVEVATNTSLTHVFRPEVVSRLEIDDIDRSVYSVVDDNGDPVSPYAWLVSGGSVQVRIGPSRDTIILTISAPSTLVRRDGSPVESFTFGSQSAQGPDQFSTLRILGSGVGLDSKTIRIATGDNNAVTEVGTTIDNPFVTSMSQVSELGARAAMKYGGFRPALSVDTPELEFGLVNGNVSRPDYDYRVRDVSHDAGSSSLTAEYIMDHETYEGFYKGRTYGRVRNDMTSPDVLTYSDDLVIGKRRP